MAEVISAAGAVLWRQARSIEIAVVHRPRYDDWALPKGKLDKGESIYAAAVREVAEETGFRAVLGRHVGQVAYQVAGVDKTVDYFAARAVAGEFAPNDEVDILRWVAPSQASAMLTYDHDRSVLDTFVEWPGDTTTVLFVRHAHAGNKSEWNGPDDERPLSDVGLAQVSALTRLLPLFGPDRVHATPKTRCVRTVAPLADLLGVPVELEPRLSESSHRGYPSCAVRRLLEIAEAGGTPVVCSQGGVIPDVVATLVEKSGVDLGEIRSRKGSVWLLTFAGAEVIATHYIPRP
jgi:8-oxo-dGTP diphosphatase